MKNEFEEGSKKRGARDRVFFCASIKDGKICNKVIVANSASDAKLEFFSKFQLEASVCEVGEGNGYYIVKGTGVSDAQRISVTVSPQQLASRTTKAYKGQFRGWNVWCSGLRACEVEDSSFDDNELVSVEFDSLVDENIKVSKPKLKKREVVRLEDINNISEL